MKHLLVISAIAVVSSANAAQWILSANLLAGNEVPPVNSPATGSFLGTYDDVTNSLVVSSMSVTGFLGDLTVSHIHVGSAGVAGGVTLNFGPNTNWTNNGGGSYTYNSPGAFTFAEANEAALLNLGTYVNVHSSFAPGGEVRGQIVATAVPEPATMAVVALGLAAMAKRRRQK